MATPTRITALEINDVKRVKAVALSPSPTGLTVIGGRNGQGKTSILDAIAWGCGGGAKAPSTPKRDGSIEDPNLKIEFSSGIVVERKGKSGALTVKDPVGIKRGQKLLDEFVSQLALDLPKFMAGNSKAKAEDLLKSLGIGKQLAELDDREKAVFDERRDLGRDADKAEKYAEGLPHHKDAPDEPVSVADLIKKRDEIQAKNQEVVKRGNEIDRCVSGVDTAKMTVEHLEQKLADAKTELQDVELALDAAKKAAVGLTVQPTTEIDAEIENADAANAMVADNAAKQEAQEKAEAERAAHKAKTRELEAVRAERMKLLDGADMPLDGLSIEAGELTYNGRQWDCMSHSEQLQVSVAIVRRQNPRCGFVLMDKLEAMDLDTLNEFGAWLDGEGLQAIATRVSTGDECTIVIEDGMIAK